MKLESFRHDEIGKTFFALIDKKGNIIFDTKFSATYTHYSFHAFYLTMQSIFN